MWPVLRAQARARAQVPDTGVACADLADDDATDADLDRDDGDRGLWACVSH